MAMYTHIGMLDSEESFTLDEHVIYGSSRLGLRKSGLELLGYIPTGGAVKRKRGLKRYELVNHLGNVNAVVSDCRNRICEGGYISHYEADIINTYDYYPFGMLMPGRSFEAEKCSTYNSVDSVFAVNEPFTTTVTADITNPVWHVGSTVTGYSVSSGRLGITSATKYSAILRYFTTVPGQTYTMRLYMDKGTATSTDIGIRYLSGGTPVVVASTICSSNGYYTLSFTAPAGVTQMWIQCQNRTNTGTSATFYIDNIKVWNIQTVTHTDCSPNPDSYLFGFNGKEKDDEVYGEGNAYDFGARIYDPRIGRWLAVDPLAGKFAAMSPYAYVNNNPIVLTDKDGKEPKPPLYQYFSGKGNVIIIIADHATVNYDAQANTQNAHNWDIVVVENAEDGAAWIKQKYGSGTQKIENLIFDSHSFGSQDEQLKIDLDFNEPGTKSAGLSADKTKEYPNIDTETKEQVDALYSLTTILGDGAKVYFTACCIATTPIADEITNKVPGNYTLIFNKNYSLTINYSDLNASDTFDEGESFSFRFDVPLTSHKAFTGASDGFVIYGKKDGVVTKTSTNELGGKKNSIQINSSGGGQLVEPSK